MVQKQLADLFVVADRREVQGRVSLAVLGVDVKLAVLEKELDDVQLASIRRHVEHSTHSPRENKKFPRSSRECVAYVRPS